MRVCPSIFGDGCHPSQQLALPHPLVELRAYYCRDTPRGLLGLCHIGASQCNQEGAPTSLLCWVSCEMRLVANKGEAGGLAWTRSCHDTRMGLTRLRASHRVALQMLSRRVIATWPELRLLARNARRRAVLLAPRLALCGPLTSSLEIARYSAAGQRRRRLLPCRPRCRSSNARYTPSCWWRSRDLELTALRPCPAPTERESMPSPNRWHCDHWGRNHPF